MTELRWLLSAIYLPITLVSIVIVTAFVCFHRPAEAKGAEPEDVAVEPGRPESPVL